MFLRFKYECAKSAQILTMQKVKLKPKKNGRVGQFLRKFAEIVIAGGPYYIQPLYILFKKRTNVKGSIL